MFDKNKGNLTALFHISIKDNGKFTDSKIMDYLGFSNYYMLNFKAGEEYEDEFSFYILRCGEWTHIIDNEYAHLFHTLKGDLHKRGIDRLKNIGMEYDLFSFSVGDITNDLEFHYYLDGKLRRKYIYEEDLSGKEALLVAIGAPLQGESQPEELGRHWEFCHALSKSLGISMQHDPHRIQRYVNTSMTGEEWHDKYMP